MATIRITRSILDQGGIVDVSLIPVFQRNSTEFDVDRGTETGTYATVKIGDFEFRAVKTATVGNVDSYIIDLTSVLKQYFGTMPDNITSPITKELTVDYNVYDSSNNLIGNTSTTNINLCLGYLDINTAGGFYDIYYDGVSKPIYHNGKISIFHNSTGTVTITIGSVEYTYSVGALVKDTFSIIPLHATQLLSGNMILGTYGAHNVAIYYKPPYGEHEIAWLNRDGGWSFWNFRQISSEIKVKRSNEVATYYPTNFETIAMSRMISAEKTVEYTFDTLAYDPTHFAQLCEIQESLAVIWRSKLMRVSACNSLTSVCKQNLRFTLKLQSDENIAGY